MAQWATATSPFLPTTGRQGKLTAPGPSFPQGLVYIPFFVKSLFPLPKVPSPSSELSDLGLGTSVDGDSKAPTPIYISEDPGGGGGIDPRLVEV